MDHRRRAEFGNVRCASEGSPNARSATLTGERPTPRVALVERLCNGTRCGAARRLRECVLWAVGVHPQASEIGQQDGNPAAESGLASTAAGAVAGCPVGNRFAKAARALIEWRLLLPPPRGVAVARSTAAMDTGMGTTLWTYCRGRFHRGGPASSFWQSLPRLPLRAFRITISRGHEGTGYRHPIYRG